MDESGIGNDRNGILVCGHLSLDLRPELDSKVDAFRPGRLIGIGPVTVTCGGAVFNTGVALHKLGLPTRLAGKIGRDAFGDLVMQQVKSQHPALADSLIISDTDKTSYSILLDPKVQDRVILHHTGANDTLAESELAESLFDHVRWCHLGYPPLLKRFYQDGGDSLTAFFRRAKAHGLATSLDMALPDAGTEAGRVDWPMFLRKVLPQVDVFVPSLEEICFMLRPHDWLDGQAQGDRNSFPVDGNNLSGLADELLAMGSAVVGIKLGEHGFYLKTAAQADRFDPLRQACGLKPASWYGKEVMVPCYKVNVMGTTGAGDTTVAGLIAAMMHRERPEEAVCSAVAVGACSVSGMNAVDGIPEWPELKRRIGSGWPRHPLAWPWDEWGFRAEKGVWHGSRID